jgi:hypothetical protein
VAVRHGAAHGARSGTPGDPSLARRLVIGETLGP